MDELYDQRPAVDIGWVLSALLAKTRAGAVAPATVRADREPRPASHTKARRQLVFPVALGADLYKELAALPAGFGADWIGLATPGADARLRIRATPGAKAGAGANCMAA